ncbi:MAG: 16S rRNA processing protein RimM [Hyphomicrobiales bacterium]|nr:16S rRNA processing protein RimM [Hyphomicrobiales bacterium]
MSKLQDPVLLAKIGAPHGVRGQVRVTSFTQDPMAIDDYGPLTSKDGQSFTITKFHLARNVLVVTFKELTTRELAQNARGLELFIERNCLPRNDDDEFYINDLINLDVLDEDQIKIGKIHGISNFGAGDLLEITPILENGRTGSKTWFLEFTKINVPKINLETHQVFIVHPTQISERDSDDDESSITIDPEVQDG